MGYLTSLKNLITTELDIVSTGVISGWLNSAANKCLEPAHDLWGGRKMTVLFQPNCPPELITKKRINAKQEEGLSAVAYRVGQFFLACVAIPFGLLFRFISMYYEPDIRNTLEGKAKRCSASEDTKNLSPLVHALIDPKKSDPKELLLVDKLLWLDLATSRNLATLRAKAVSKTTSVKIEDCDGSTAPDPLLQTLSILLSFNKPHEYFRYLFDHRKESTIEQLIDDLVCQMATVPLRQPRNLEQLEQLLIQMYQLRIRHEEHCDHLSINSKWDELMGMVSSNDLNMRSLPIFSSQCYKNRFQDQVNYAQGLSSEEFQKYISQQGIYLQLLKQSLQKNITKLKATDLKKSNPSEQQHLVSSLTLASNTSAFMLSLLKTIEPPSPEQDRLNNILDEVDDLTALDNAMETPQPRPASDENTGKQTEPSLLTPQEEYNLSEENFTNCVEMAKTMSPEAFSEVISTTSKALGNERKALDELKDKLSSSTLSPVETAELNQRLSLSQRKASYYNRLVEELEKISLDAMLDDVFDEFETTSTLESSAPNLNSVAAQGVEGAAHLGSVDGSTEAGNDGDGKPLSKSIESGVENAVLQSNPNEHNVGDLAAAEISG